MTNFQELLCAVAKPGHRKNQSCVKKLCVAAARLLYLSDYQANTQYDAYHCTADQCLGALDLEVLIEINTECRSYHTLWEEKKETNSRYFPEQQVVLTPQRNTSSQVSQIMNYGNYKSVIFWGLCILETQLYSEKKKQLPSDNTYFIENWNFWKQNFSISVSLNDVNFPLGKYNIFFKWELMAHLWWFFYKTLKCQSLN